MDALFKGRGPPIILGKKEIFQKDAQCAFLCFLKVIIQDGMVQKQTPGLT